MVMGSKCDCMVDILGEKLIAYVGEGQTLNISCPEGQVIKIASANFGRSVSFFFILTHNFVE